MVDQVRPLASSDRVRDRDRLRCPESPVSAAISVVGRGDDRVESEDLQRAEAFLAMSATATCTYEGYVSVATVVQRVLTPI